MICLSTCRCQRASRVVLGFLLLSVPAAFAEDEKQVKQRLEYVQGIVEGLAIESSELESKDALKLVPKPLLRYSDPTRGLERPVGNVLVDGVVWRLGTEGRPSALVAIELYQAVDGSRTLSYEFLSLTAKKYSLKHKTQQIRWDATGSALVMKELPEAPKPAAAPAARLTQMRQLSRRFEGKELYQKEWIECRLIAQPIDRYGSDAQKIVDGAIFAMANGTNPEIGIVIETDGKSWQYGTFRLSDAELSISLDGRQVATYEHRIPSKRTDGPYHNGTYKIKKEK